MRCSGLRRLAIPAYLSPFFSLICPVLPRTALPVVSAVRALGVAGSFVSHMRACRTEEEQSVGPLARRRDLEAQRIPPS
jgi:hypothetical protein